jgi:hypothetical protein
MNARTKAENDMALNLSELAVVTGYTRPVLSRMKLPLIEGKISPRDFWRIMRRRQDWMESPSYMVDATTTSAFPVVDYSTLATVDKFRAPRSKNGQPSASPSRAARLARNIE